MDEIKTVAVLGAGDMGHGIAEVALIAGFKTFMYDVSAEIVGQGAKRIQDSLEKLAAKNRVPADLPGRVKDGLLAFSDDLARTVEKADLVIEAAPEVMDLKKKIFAQVDKIVRPHCLLATNTSTMSVTELGRATSRPTRFLGVHYFNPAVLMKAVEVIKGADTAEETMAAGVAYCEKTGKVPVRVEKDVPGFIANRVQAPSVVLLSAILDSGEIEPEEVDAALRKIGMPMGPYETMDYTGLDVNYNASRYFAQAVHPDFAPGKVLTSKYEKGELGKKTGRGIFDWSAGRPAIRLDRATSKVDPMDLIAVQVNEATKIVGEGVCSIEDVDKVLVNGTGALMGPMALARGMRPEDLAARLENLARRFNKEIFKPTEGVKKGLYKGPAS